MIFPHFGSHRLVQSSQFGFMAIILNVVGCKFPKPITKSKDFEVIFYCYFNYPTMIVYEVTQIEQVVYS